MGVPAAGSRPQLTDSSQVGDTLLEIANLELDFAAAQLAAFSADPEKAVHQCRRSIKRLRALIRIGIAVPGAHPRPLDRRLRDAGRFLAPIRDASEVKGTLRRTLEAYPQLESLSDLARISDDMFDVDVSIEKALAKLEKARSRLPEFFAVSNAWTFTSVATGIEASYVRAATELYRFSRKHTDRIGHAWRKEVQCLRNQLNLIEPLCPDLLSPMLQTLSRLADSLGQHNDLAVLRIRLKARRTRLPEKTLSALREVVRVDQRRLREEAIEVGDDFFGMSPDRFRSLLLSECADARADSAVLRSTS